MEPATKEEIQYLKQRGALGKRAPSCSLLSLQDMKKLLANFAKDDTWDRLIKAVSNAPQRPPNTIHLITLPPGQNNGKHFVSQKVGTCSPFFGFQITHGRNLEQKCDTSYNLTPHHPRFA